MTLFRNVGEENLSGVARSGSFRPNVRKFSRRETRNRLATRSARILGNSRRGGVVSAVDLERLFSLGHREYTEVREDEDGY